MKLFTRWATWIVAVLLSVWSVSSYATFEDQMRNTFGSMVNVTAPGTIDGQKMGGVSGGSLFLRNSVVKPNLLQFKPPSASAGCSGINMFTGSFQMINAKEIKDLLNAVASNAVGYFFHLAIDAVCPTCGDNLKSLAAKINSLNQHMMSSCEIAQTLVDAPGTENMLKVAAEKSGLNQALSGGIGYISQAKYWPSIPDTPNPAAKQAAQDATAGKVGNAATATGNVVWNALKGGNIKNWFDSNGEFGSGTSVGLYETLMNLSGTVILRKNPAYDWTEPVSLDTLTKPDAIEPLTRTAQLDFKDFLNGAQAKKIWVCQNPNDECLDVALEERDIPGFKAFIHDLLFGGGTNPGSPGIVAKIRAKDAGSVFTDDEKMLIAKTSPGILALLRTLSYDLRAAEPVIQKFENLVAVELASNLVYDMIGSIELAVRTVPALPKGDAIGLITAARQKIRDSKNSVVDTSNEVTNLFAVAARVKESLFSIVKNSAPGNKG